MACWFPDQRPTRVRSLAWHLRRKRRGFLGRRTHQSSRHGRRPSRRWGQPARCRPRSRGTGRRHLRRSLRLLRLRRRTRRGCPGCRTRRRWWHGRRPSHCPDRRARFRASSSGRRRGRIRMGKLRWWRQRRRLVRTDWCFRRTRRCWRHGRRPSRRAGRRGRRRSRRPGSPGGQERLVLALVRRGSHRQGQLRCLRRHQRRREPSRSCRCLLRLRWKRSKPLRFRRQAVRRRRQAVRLEGFPQPGWG